MRILFTGSPELAVPCLEAVSRGHDICGVLTNPDRPAGRSKKAVPTPVKKRALELGLRVLQPGALDHAFLKEAAALQPQLLVVAAFGRIFKKEFLDLFPGGGINLHPSLLPRWRGPSPIAAAILHGDRETGVSVQRLALKMDSGDILAQERLELSGRETTGELSETLSHMGADLLCRVLEGLEQGNLTPVVQDEAQATYCRLVRKDDGRVDWNQDAASIERLIRACDPWPLAFTFWKGTRIHLLQGRPLPEAELGGEPGLRSDLRPGLRSDLWPGLVLGADKDYGILVQTGKGVLALARLQAQSRKPLGWAAFLNGKPGFIGSALGGQE